MSVGALLLTLFIGACVGGVLVMILCHDYGNPITRVAERRKRKKARKKVWQDMQTDLSMTDGAIMSRMLDSSNAPQGAEGDERWGQWRRLN